MSGATDPGIVSGSDPRTRTLDYRPDIDGLRALAVMLVVLNHVGVALFSGGYVGVDVFCVISGYLITGLIAVQQRQGRFSLRAFYMRRAERLLPALYAMMLFVLVAGWWLLIPSDYSGLAQSALSAVGLGANIYFWGTSGGYFSPDAAALPLLHVWSLSLEEQFYLLWPMALLGLMKLRSKGPRIGLTSLAAVASFSLAQFSVAQGSTAAYFLLPHRAGEFLVGALLFQLSGTWPRSGRRSLAISAGFLGLGLVLGSALTLHADSPFPGLVALAPCVGAALLIAAAGAGDNPVSRGLSVRPIVFVGRISYSVYLWHWPLVSFLHYARVEFTLSVVVGVVSASLLLGLASWALFERSFRLQFARRHRPALAAGGLVAVAIVAGPIAIHVSDGFPQRFPYALLTQDELLAERARYWRDLPAAKYRFSGTADIPQTLIVGNSHAYDLAYALTENGYPGEVKLIGTTQLCANFGATAVQAVDAEHCAERRSAVLQSHALKSADVILLHDHWPIDDLGSLTVMIQDLREVTAAPIVVFGPKMTFTDDVLAISRAAQGRRYITVGAINRFSTGYQDRSKVERDRRLKAFFASREFENVRYVSALDVQCGRAIGCDILSSEGGYLYFDAGHFTLGGARMFGARLRAAHPVLFAPPNKKAPPAGGRRGS